jgi:hypothetical protein
MCSYTAFTTHYRLPGWDTAVERRDAQDELHSAAQARARGLTATSMRTTTLLPTARPTRGRPAH